MKTVFFHLALILAGALLFAASFPNPLFPNGLAFLAWFAFIPVFWVTRRGNCAAAALWGAVYGYLSYFLLAPWLASFHPLAGMAASLLQMIYMALLFPLLRLAWVFYPRRGCLLQWLLWLSYEYLRTLGFLGFPYGISGYTQWRFIPLLGTASVFGVWGVSALVVFPSAYLAAALGENGGALSPFSGPGEGCRKFFRRERPVAAVWLAALAAALVFGWARADYRKESRGAVTIALVQQNSDPWQNDLAGYRRALRTLTGLSRRAADGADLVVWSETAFVPRIYWHLTYRDRAESWPVVQELLDFLAGQRTPFLIGNDDARLEPAGGDNWDQVDYNAALLFEGPEIRQVYRKQRLVPFAEYFPYEKTFPRLHRALVDADIAFWKPGAEATVFDTGTFRFSAPICFEDSFGWISRDFTRRGAECIINLTNDSWAEDLSCQMQHLAMSVFRAAENRRSLVRAAASGQTCAVSPSGAILAMAPAFTETVLSVTVPLLETRTLYTAWGDLWARLFCAAAGILLLAGMIRSILRIIKAGRSL